MRKDDKIRTGRNEYGCLVGRNRLAKSRGKVRTMFREWQEILVNMEFYTEWLTWAVPSLAGLSGDSLLLKAFHSPSLQVPFC